MADNKTTINDTRVRMRPSKKLLELIANNNELITEIPENLAKALKSCGYSVPAQVETIATEGDQKVPCLDIKLLKQILNDTKGTKKVESISPQEEKESSNKNSKSDDGASEQFLYLSDLKWLNNFLSLLRKTNGVDLYLHNFIENCALELPENEVIKRNPILEARCEKLRNEQKNREYRKMTKNVDAVLKNYPEDTIAYQMKAMNSQIIAVLQFVFSVVAGFVFGFLGVELIVGNLEFGFRLLLGIMCALIIALAEIYFLAKKLNEYDDVTAAAANYESSPGKARKPHID